MFDPEDENPGIKQTCAGCWVSAIVMVEPYEVMFGDTKETVVGHFNDKILFENGGSALKRSHLIKKIK